MNPKQLTILAVLVAVAGGVYFMVNSKQQKAISRANVEKIGDSVLQALDVPSITSVSIIKTGQVVNLKKEGENWVVAERENFPADATKIRALLYGLKDLKISESRSMRGAAVLKELQLLDPESADVGGSGTGTTVKFSGGGDTGKLIFGKDFSAASGRTGRFIVTESGAVHVVATSLMNLETGAAAWLDKKDFFNVEKSKSIAVAHEKPEDSFTLVRETDGSPLALENPAEGEEIDTGKISGFSNLFSSARFADYVIGDAAKPEATGLDKPTTANIETFDGFKYAVSVGKMTDDSKYYLSYQVTAEIPEPPAEPAAPVAEPDKELTEEEKTKAEQEKSDWEAKVADIKRLKEKLATEQKNAAKVFTVDSWTVQAMMKPRSELLKTAEDKAKEAAEAAAGGGTPGVPNVITQGPDGKPRITATTPPVSIDPKLLEAERLKQEQAVKDRAKAQADGAAIQKMIEDHRREQAEDGKDPKADATPAGEEATPAGEEAKPAGEEAKPAGEEVKPAGEEAKPAGEEATPAGDAATPAGEEATPAGDAATPAGEDATPAGEEVKPANE